MALLLLYHLLSFLYLFPYGLYHLISSIRSYLIPSPSPYKALPFHPLPFPSSPFRSLPLHFSLVCLLLSCLLSPFLFPSFLLSLQFTFPLLLFTLLSIFLLFSPPPSDLVFLLASLSFYLLSLASSNSSSSFPTTDLQSKSLSLSSLISLVSALSSLTLAISPRLFLAELTLASSISLHGLWSLQSGLSLYSDAFIPNGCHTLLEKSGVTRCDLDESRARAVEIFDLAFVFHATVVAVIAVAAYGVVARVQGVSGGNGNARRHNSGAYEVLPTSSVAVDDLEHHVPMKAMPKTTAQE
ncbi:hypothetical protein LUZ63_017001 [Rhynchospora breviuscula]|uniref:Uncharacterized protein n=1 Tax=Rhynchospora breviuscula TaxID=2022672 RepID=A0A9Q0C1M1_9POAL|nr:hypothetical protein LUZ63_017001 [Rhynchospora breviuscula]